MHKHPSEPLEKMIERLTHQMPALTHALEKQNNWGRRFLMGVLVGVGSAMGAGIIATLLIFLFRQLLHYWFHVDLSNIQIPSAR